ncbi:MAG TPA: hypothetical protein VJG31_04180 [Candidatus Nanoarchaeia archaeon]|nr:hypothetical protein [Candidatus Nanoarchaeia archaeon]
MDEWDKDSEEISKVVPDKEKARSLLRLVELREKDLAGKTEEFSTLIVEGRYEIVKELITALMSADGYKSLSHKLLISYLKEFYPDFSMGEIILLDQLRKIRNDIAYRGLMIKPDYLQRNVSEILEITTKLKKILLRKLNL